MGCCISLPETIAVNGAARLTSTRVSCIMHHSMENMSREINLMKCQIEMVWHI